MNKQIVAAAFLELAQRLADDKAIVLSCVSGLGEALVKLLNKNSDGW